MRQQKASKQKAITLKVKRNMIKRRETLTICGNCNTAAVSGENSAITHLTHWRLDQSIDHWEHLIPLADHCHCHCHCHHRCCSHVPWQRLGRSEVPLRHSQRCVCATVATVSTCSRCCQCDHSLTELPQCHPIHHLHHPLERSVRWASARHGRREWDSSCAVPAQHRRLLAAPRCR